MISRKFRLPSGSFRSTKSKITTLSFFSVKYFPNQLSHNRFGFIISNQVEKKSTRRHFWQRRFFNILKSWPAMGLDILIVARPGFSKLEIINLERELAQVLKKIKSHHG